MSELMYLLKYRQHMISPIVKAYLEGQGYNQNEIKVYIDLVAHGQSYASTVAVRTKLDRTTVYSILKKLSSQGIIVQTHIEGVNAYIALSPDVFLNKLDYKIESLQAERRLTSDFIEQISQIQQTKFDYPKIQIYEGEEAIISLYEGSLKDSDQQKAFLTLKNIPQKLKNYLQSSYIQQKITKNVQSQVLVADSSVARKYKEKDLTSNRETKLITKYPFELHSELILFQQSKIAIIDFHKAPYGIVVQSSTLYKTMLTIFDCLWLGS